MSTLEAIVSVKRRLEIQNRIEPFRALSMAITKLEEAAMWLAGHRKLFGKANEQQEKSK
jgi:hypothetical protein